ncbi:uncharacterized protein LOC143264508 [Megachile rotundata]|uniref:uncharacterized protein LOC143264508 n=1 Tax=Megachile rotundata TaxID=143995 RepID=UPI003FD4294D
MTMDNITTLQTGIEKMDIVANKENEEGKEQEERVEVPKPDSVKEEPSPPPQNTPAMSGRKIRKMIKRLLRYAPSARAAGRGGYRGRGDYRGRGGYRGTRGNRGGREGIRISGCTIYGGIRN